MSQESGPILVGGTTFYCSNPAEDASRLTGSFDLSANASSIEFNIIYQDGDTTNYRLDFWINGGEKESMTITPENHYFTKNGTYTSFKCNLTVPAQGGNVETNCRIRIFK